MIRPAEIDAAIEALAHAGFLAPTAEAAELAACADHGDELRALVARRTTGEPLAWITGTTTFCGETIRVDPGVYVPRPQTEPMAEAAVRLLPAEGIAVDLCTGFGAIAAVLARRRPGARVLASDIDPRAVACARSNGVHAHRGDLDQPLPPELHGRVDVVTGVVPYVPTESLHLLPGDVRDHEPEVALDGGPGGTRVLDRAVAAAARLLRPGGWLLLEVGGSQPDHLGPDLARRGFGRIEVATDEEGDARSIRARATPARPPAS